MNKELLQSAKDQAAREAGYNTFEELLSVDGYLSDNTTLINRAMEIYAEMVNGVKWMPKNEFQPVDGEWYWAIIPKENGSGWYLPQQAKYYNGEYHVWTTRNDVPTLMQMTKFTHIAEIIYPKPTKP